ncbi:hypothetical protein ABPG72_016248 [Tetrahymena utriculariae]
MSSLSKRTDGTSNVASSSTAFLSSNENILSSSSFGILANSLVNQKISYLLLVKSILPEQVYESLVDLKYWFPTQMLKQLNAFKPLISQSLDQYQDNRYCQIGISFNILQTSGQTCLKLKDGQPIKKDILKLCIFNNNLASINYINGFCNWDQPINRRIYL